MRELLNGSVETCEQRNRHEEKIIEKNGGK